MPIRTATPISHSHLTIFIYLCSRQGLHCLRFLKGFNLKRFVDKHYVNKDVVSIQNCCLFVCLFVCLIVFLDVPRICKQK